MYHEVYACVHCFLSTTLCCLVQRYVVHEIFPQSSTSHHACTVTDITLHVHTATGTSLRVYNICQRSSASNGMDTRGSHFVCLYTAMFLSLDHFTAVTVTVEMHNRAHRDTQVVDPCITVHCIHKSCIYISSFPVYSSSSTSERHH